MPTIQPIANPASTLPAVANPASKWWGQSLTLWGVAITTLSTVLPTVAPLFGLDLNAELTRQLGQQPAVAAQAVGGLVGTALSIYGRLRATPALERRQITMNL
jgi:hypothetical protein